MRQKILVFRMTSIMVAGFSFTMLPYGIICMMFYTSSIDCQGHTLPYTMITFLRCAFWTRPNPDTSQTLTRSNSGSNQTGFTSKHDCNQTSTHYILSLTSCVLNSSIYNFLSKNFRTQMVAMIGIKRLPKTVSIYIDSEPHYMKMVKILLSSFLSQMHRIDIFPVLMIVVKE